MRSGRAAARAAEGAALGALTWVAAGQLGAAAVIGAGELRGLWIAALAGAAAAWWRPVLPRAAAVVVAVVLGVVAYTPLAPALLRVHVRDDLRGRAAADPVDAVAVLGSDVQRDGLSTGRSLERLLAGLEWARRLDRPLVLSVIHDRSVRGAVSSEADQRRLAALAGRERGGALYFVDSVRVTRDEAVRTAALARARGWRRVMVVTSPSHSRRACAAYERAGLRVTCAPAPSRDYPLGGPRPMGGARDRVRAFRDWCYESLGWRVYQARGWV